MSSKSPVKKIIGFVIGLIFLFVYSQFVAPNLDSPEKDKEAFEPDSGGPNDLGTKSSPKKGLSNSDKDLLGQLKERAGGELVSTAGLRYTRGSQEGHRLKHVRRHDNDLPDREGSHGVFDGDEAQMLAIIDEAYLLVKKKDAAASIRRDGSRSIWTVDLKRDIGFVGGTGGKRKGNPSVQSVRLVLEGDQLITAYPVAR